MRIDGHVEKGGKTAACSHCALEQDPTRDCGSQRMVSCLKLRYVGEEWFSLFLAPGLDKDEQANQACKSR